MWKVIRNELKFKISGDRDGNRNGIKQRRKETE